MSTMTDRLTERHDGQRVLVRPPGGGLDRGRPGRRRRSSPSSSPTPSSRCSSPPRSRSRRSTTPALQVPGLLGRAAAQVRGARRLRAAAVQPHPRRRARTPPRSAEIVYGDGDPRQALIVAARVDGAAHRHAAGPLPPVDRRHEPPARPRHPRLAAGPSEHLMPRLTIRVFGCIEYGCGPARTTSTPTHETLGSATLWVAAAGGFVARVLRPAVLGVAAGEVLAHGGPRAGPEAGQVGGDLDRAVGGREQRHRERHAAAGDRRVLAARRTRPAPGRRPSGAPRRSRSPPSRPVGSVHDRGRELVEVGAERPRQHRAQQDRRGRGGRGRPARWRRRGTAPATRRACRAARRRTRRATRRRTSRRRNAIAGAQLRRRRRPRQDGEPGRPHPLDQRGRRRLTRRRPAPLLAEAQRVEAPLDALDEVVGAVVPLQPAVLDRRRRAAGRSRPASTAAPRRMRAFERLPSRSAATTNGAPASGSSSATHAPVPLRSWNWAGRPARREAVREPGEEGDAGEVGVDRAGVEAHAGAAGDVGGPLADPVGGPPVGAVVADVDRTRSPTRRARSAGRRSPRPRSTSRSSTTAATTHASESGRATTIRARRGWTGRPTIDRPTAVMAPASSSAPRSVSSSTAWRRAFAGGASTNDSCSAGVPHAASSSTKPARSTWVISAARCAGRVPCSMRLHSR